MRTPLCAYSLALLRDTGSFNLQRHTPRSIATQTAKDAPQHWLVDVLHQNVVVIHVDLRLCMGSRGDGIARHCRLVGASRIAVDPVGLKLLEVFVVRQPAIAIVVGADEQKDIMIPCFDIDEAVPGAKIILFTAIYTSRRSPNLLSRCACSGMPGVDIRVAMIASALSAAYAARPPAWRSFCKYLLNCDLR
jgi:hypothetical protein